MQKLRFFLLIIICVGISIPSVGRKTIHAADRLTTITVVVGKGMCNELPPAQRDGDMTRRAEADALWQSKKIKVSFSLQPDIAGIPANAPRVKLFFGNKILKAHPTVLCQDEENPAPRILPGLTGNQVTMVGKWQNNVSRNFFNVYEIHAPVDAESAYLSQVASVKARGLRPHEEPPPARP